jgi:cyclopropane-fatty-acyl-phospholipid synthase
LGYDRGGEGLDIGMTHIRHQRFHGYPIVTFDRNFAGPKADHLVSMGMFEHVGAKNYRIYFECARRYMKDDGLFLLRTIWENERHPAIDTWQDKYIFPNGDLPSVGAALGGQSIL